MDTFDCTISSSSPEISPAPLDDGHRSPPVSPPHGAGSVVPLRPKSTPGMGSKLFSLPWQQNTTRKNRSYTEIFLNQLKSLNLGWSPDKTLSENQPTPNGFKEWPKSLSCSLWKNYFGNQPKSLRPINLVLKARSRRNSRAGMRPVWQRGVQMQNIWLRGKVSAPSSPG